MNYKIKKGEWTTLKDVMGSNYDATRNYAIHVNEISLGFLKLYYSDSVPTVNEGREIPQHSVIHIGVDEGAEVYLMGTCADVDINIFEVK